MATTVFERLLPLSKGQTIVCETRNLSAGGDPVLHILSPADDLLDAPGLYQRTELARNDNVDGGLNARVSFTAPRKGTYLLVLRANRAATPGIADVACDGVVVSDQVPFGGAFMRLLNLRSRELLQTVPLARGPHAHQLYLLDADGRMLFQTPSLASGTAMLRELHLASVTVMVGSKADDPPGPVRLVRNDAGVRSHDPDNDGLGSELEASIGTCSTKTDIAGGNWECSRTVDLRDTDGDGLRDDLELVGRLGAAPYQYLPRWGADPRHKDLFIEVDYALPLPNDHRLRKMSPELAHKLAALYGDQESDPVLRLLHAQSLMNPDANPGITMHFDTGMDPTEDAPAGDWTLYGDWGGYTAVPAIKVDGKWQRADAKKVWNSRMTSRRRGVFHYALGYLGSGGQAPYDTIALNMPLSDESYSQDDLVLYGTAGTAAHELGHTLGLSHAGSRIVPNDANCKPNYPSVMNYAYGNSAEPQEDGAAEGKEDDTGMTPPDANGKRPRKFYRFPNSFADGYGPASLNNTALRERAAVANPGSVQGKRYLQNLEKIFSYEVNHANGDVDWNRDGVISDDLVRAYANDNGECEYTRMNQLALHGLSDGAPAIARLDGRTFLIYSDERDRKLHVEFTDNALDCAPAVTGCGPALQNRVVNKSWNKGILNLDAHVFTDGSQRKLLVVYTTANGLFETTMTKDFVWSTPVAIPTSSTVVDEMSLAGSGANVVMAYKNADGYPLYKRRSPDGMWDSDVPVVDREGVPIGPLGVLSAPALLEATMLKGTKLLFGAFPVGATGTLRLYVQDSQTNRWVSIDSNESASLIGQPWEWTLDDRFERIRSRSNIDHYLHNQSGYLSTGPIDAGAPGTDGGWHSAQWAIDRVEPPYVRIRNRWKAGEVMYIDAVDNLRIGSAPQGDPGTMWMLEPTSDGFVRIRNRAKPTLFIHSQFGATVVGPIQPEWASAQWKVVPTMIGSGEDTFGRPALTFEPVSGNSPLPGRLRIIYLHRGSDTNHVVRSRILEVVKTYRGDTRYVLRARNFDNGWYFGNGLDAFFEAGTDTNVRVVVSTAMLKEGKPQPHVMQFRPKADGIIDVTYSNFDDWDMLGRQLCRRLSATGAGVNCP